MAVGILTQFKKGLVEVKLGTGFFLKNPVPNFLYKYIFQYEQYCQYVPEYADFLFFCFSCDQVECHVCDNSH